MRGHRAPRRSRLTYVAAVGIALMVALIASIAITGASPTTALSRGPGLVATPAVSSNVVASRGSMRAAGAGQVGAAGPRTTRLPARGASLDASAPQRLTIASIGVDTDVMDLGLEPDGTLEVPPGAFPAGWYDGSPTPGELGPAVLAGHVSYGGTAGVFERLHELDRGDEVTVLREDGSVAVFVVSRTEDYVKSAFPTDTVYGDIDHAGLRLITCGGLDPETGTYEDNVVVFAELSRG